MIFVATQLLRIAHIDTSILVNLTSIQISNRKNTACILIGPVSDAPHSTAIRRHDSQYKQQTKLDPPGHTGSVGLR